MICRALTTTTRPPRPGEEHGKDYFFVSKETFAEYLDQDLFLEHASIHGHSYGVQKRTLEKQFEEYGTIILNIDYQGLKHIQSVFANRFSITSVFILPKNIEVWQERLRKRYAARAAQAEASCQSESESQAEIELRVKNGYRELENRCHYDVTVINDQLAVAGQELLDICQTANR